MADKLSDLLARRGWLLADGAMGTSLFALGLESGDAPDLWNIDAPEKVAEVHRGFVDAGADIILTNTFGANRYRLQLHAAEQRVLELNRAGAAIAREVVDRAGREGLVAGDIGPTGELMQPVGPLAHADAVAAFAEQAAGLAAGGADLLWIETMSSKEEVAAAVEGAASVGLPVIATMSFDTNGRTMMGITPFDAVRHAHHLAVPLAAFGANCGVGPGTLVDSVLGLGSGAEPGDVIVAKGNCGLPEYRDGELVYSGTPETMTAYARLARDAGARIIGGCCGTTAAHVAAMRAALDGYEPGPPPERAAIETALGPIDAPAARAAGHEAEPARRRRRRE